MHIIKRVIWLVVFYSVSAIAAAPTADFSLKDIHGKQHHLADYRGKWVVVNYWATWCPPCLDEIPELIDFHEKHKGKDAVVLGINYEEDIDVTYLRKFVEEYLISYPVLRGNPDGPAPLGQIYGLPSTFIISPEGEVVSRRVGGITQAQLEQFLGQQKTKTSMKTKV
jgi:thiol-disulfide isomerase/thioredoxin